MADPKDKEVKLDAETVKAAVKALMADPDAKSQLLDELRRDEMPTHQRVQENVLRGANYPIPKQYRLEKEQHYFAAQVGKILEPYVGEDGNVKYPPNGLGMVTFNGKLQLRMVGSMEVKTKGFSTYDKRMCEWIEGHPDYGLRVFSRATDSNLSAAAMLNHLSAGALAHYKNMSHGQLLAEATRLGVPHTDNPHTLRANVAAKSAEMRLKQLQQKKAQEAGLLNKELAAYAT